MRAITLQQPWAWLVVNGYKRWEYRTWSTDHRGLLVVHASGRRDWLSRAYAMPELAAVLPERDGLAYGAVVGAVNVVGVEAAQAVRDRMKPAEVRGGHAWLLDGGRALERPVRCLGRLMLWELPVDVEQRVAEGLGLPVSAGLFG